RVFDSTAPGEVWQGVRAGDAAEQLDGNTLAVATSSLSDQVLGNLGLGSGVLTPNGDGANEQLQISYDLLKLTSPLPVVVQVWDLAGRRVAQVYEGMDLAGRHLRVWDGRDEGGQLVHPGLYICQVEVETTAGRQTRSRLLTVAY
ncbi:MAG: gliding motility-associated C-terminal domain-containing protein, partial [Candidatus Latescibacteria bacterium]|nr:gliding motility-associated C-terminal domain-containing protein [Candidatus Latescibacterota bacterium]